MCWEGKCFGCLPVEHACLALAIISAVSTGLGLLACFIMGILIIGGVAIGEQAAKQALPWESAAGTAAYAVGALAGVVVLVVGVACLVAFIFSVLLCNGICKRRPGPVKAYFIYGVTITVMAVLAAAIELMAGGPTEFGVPALLGCAVYSLFLVLVYQTYMKMLKGVVFQDHVRLVGPADNQSFVSHG